MKVLVLGDARECSHTPALQLEHTLSPVLYGCDQLSCPEPSSSFLKLFLFSTNHFCFQLLPRLWLHCYLISPSGSESDALLVVNSKHERIIINAIIKLITNVKKNPNDSSIKPTLWDESFPRDPEMFWSGKECRIPLTTANHTRYEQLTALNKEILE